MPPRGRGGIAQTDGIDRFRLAVLFGAAGGILLWVACLLPTINHVRRHDLDLIDLTPAVQATIAFSVFVLPALVLGFVSRGFGLRTAGFLLVVGLTALAAQLLFAWGLTGGQLTASFF